MTSTRRRGLIDIEIDAQKEKVRKIKEDNRIFDTLETDKTTLDNEKKKWFFTRWFSPTSIDDLEKRIARKEQKIKEGLERTSIDKIHELEERIRILELAKTNRCENVVWMDVPEILDKKIQDDYLEKFRKLPQKIDEQVQSVNITMFGGVGVGKSSFLNTVVTALINNPQRIYRDYKTAPSTTGISKTKAFQLDKLKVGDTRVVPIRFYDCPGINEDEYNTMNLDVLEAVIKGHVKEDSTFNPEEIRKKRGQSYREHPTFKDVMHCIVFVIPATTNLYDRDDEALNKIRNLQQRINGPRDVKQVAIVTNIDRIGVPNVDMESVFKYPNVKEFCEDVSKVLEIEIQSVYPIANYHEEQKPTAAKNALALMALWDMFKCGERHIKKKLEIGLNDDQ
ncbi:interferon-induced protein 44-like isoform X1 [Crassostrea virginica]